MEIFEKLKPNTTIITPNRRLTATLLEKYQDYALARNKICWPTLDILPYQSWIQRLWDDVSITHMDTENSVLSNQQEHILWEDIIRRSPKNDSLLQLSATAELAKSAWGTLKQWQVDIHHPMLTMTEDSQAFQEWAVEFHTLCFRHHWIDFNTVEHSIIEYIKNQHVTLPSEIMVLGFTELSPTQHTLFEKCEAAGTCITLIENLHHSSEQANKKSFFISLSDNETELVTMARWAKHLLDNHDTAKSLKIGCIIPNLENNRDRVIQIFSDVFSHQDFNISAGKSLITYPIIHAAMKILQLSDENITIEKISHLLRTPFIGEAELELTKRAAFDAHLRSDNKMTIRPAELEKFGVQKYCPHFAKRIIDLIKKWQSQPENLLPSDWVKHVIEVLSILGWPGERSMNSQEYQIVQRFLDLLNEYQSFDAMTQEISYSDAIQHIQRLATKTIFQPQSNHAPVQILGLLEAANLPFDYAWVVGLDDSVWPPSAKPNPFIPPKLQKSLQMPHATAEKELHYSTKLTEQFKQSSNIIIFSHALKSGDCDLRPSALISACKQLTIDEIKQSDFTTPAEMICQSKSLESIHDEQAPSVQPDEKLRGGVSIFKQQAACAFKAFAEIRLHARKLESPIIGLRPQDRGIITHKALELLWQEIKDHETLNYLNDTELKAIIDRCANTAIEFKTNESVFKLRYLTLESQRLRNLLWNWLLLEKKRPFFKVISQEEDRTMSIGALSLTLRVDRIDQLENGDLCIIDYKTGKYNSIKYWFSDRPEEPQLPLYCLSDPSKVKAIAFAEVHPDKLALLGISQTHFDIDKIKSLQEIEHGGTLTWDEQVQSWAMIFEKLAHEFIQGNAYVSPKNDVETCQYCDLKPLCRIHEYRAEHYET